jgi:hypothetical protein
VEDYYKTLVGFAFEDAQQNSEAAIRVSYLKENQECFEKTFKSKSKPSDLERFDFENCSWKRLPH